MTPAAIAVDFNDRDTLKVFIDSNAGLDAKIQGRTLLQYAEQNHRPELAEMLRRRGK